MSSSSVYIFSPKEFLAKERLEKIRWWASMTQKPTMQGAYEELIGELDQYLNFLDAKNDTRIFLYDAKETRYYLVYPVLAYQKAFIESDTCLSYELEKNPHQVLITDEFSYKVGPDEMYHKRYDKLIIELKHLKSEVLIPLHMGDVGKYGEIGFIILGKKKQNKHYTTNDIEFLESFAFSATDMISTMMFQTGIEE